MKTSKKILRSKKIFLSSKYSLSFGKIIIPPSIESIYGMETLLTEDGFPLLTELTDMVISYG